MASINHIDSSGGINQHSSPELKPTNTSPLALNVTLDMDGAVASRSGSDLLHSASSSGSVYGMGVQRRSNGAERFFWTTGGALYYYDGSSWANAVSSEGIADGAPIDFNSYNGELYYLGLSTASTTVPSGITWVRSGTDTFDCTNR